MIFYYLFYILIGLSFLYISQFYFDQDEFVSFIKIFFAGVLFTFLYKLLFGFIDRNFLYTAYPSLILIKKILLDGVLFLGASTAFFTYIYKNMNISTDWRNTSFIFLSFLCGAYTVISIRNIGMLNIPNSVLLYSYLLSEILLISVITGFGIFKFKDSSSIFSGTAFLITSVLTASAISGLFKYYYFMNSAFTYLLILITLPVLFIYIKKEII